MPRRSILTTRQPAAIIDIPAEHGDDQKKPDWLCAPILLGKAIMRRKRASMETAENLLRHTSPLGWVYPNKAIISITGIGGVRALSACSFVIASGWFQQSSVTRHWEFHSALMWLNIFCMVTSRFWRHRSGLISPTRSSVDPPEILPLKSGA